LVACFQKLIDAAHQKVDIVRIEMLIVYPLWEWTLRRTSGEPHVKRFQNENDDCRGMQHLNSILQSDDHNPTIQIWMPSTSKCEFQRLWLSVKERRYRLNK
jgi:hypothetical protein